MSLWEIIIIAFSVSLDAFAVSVSGALCKTNLRRSVCAFNAALFFGGFQFLMPLSGAAAAMFARKFVLGTGTWIAFILLDFTGGKMIVDALKKKDPQEKCPIDNKFFAWNKLFLPAVATSLDAMAIGAGLAFAGEKLLLPAAAMGVVTAAMSACGVFLGTKMQKLCNPTTMTVIGGSAIILIGAKILFLSH